MNFNEQEHVLLLRYYNYFILFDMSGKVEWNGRSSSRVAVGNGNKRTEYALAL